MPDPVWEAFTTAGFTCWPDAGPVVVRPAPRGTTSGVFPFSDPVTFVTADNPWGQAAPDNEARRRRLVEALDRLGLTWVPAVGGDPDGAHREPGAAVVGLSLPSALEMGARFEQAAIYVWEPEALHLVACAVDRHDVLGYVARSGRPASPSQLKIR